jgi:hypothetical protein
MPFCPHSASTSSLTFVTLQADQPHLNSTEDLAVKLSSNDVFIHGSPQNPEQHASLKYVDVEEDQLLGIPLSLLGQKKMTDKLENIYDSANGILVR